MKLKTLAFGAIAMTGLAACQITGTPVGFGATPPTLVQGEDGLAWANAGSFGPVPPADQARGDAICGAVPTVNGGTASALAYHPAAIDENGNRIEGGGFLCG